LQELEDKESEVKDTRDSDEGDRGLVKEVLAMGSALNVLLCTLYSSDYDENNAYTEPPANMTSPSDATPLPISMTTLNLITINHSLMLNPPASFVIDEQ
jgi:hypothetical protein